MIKGGSYPGWQLWNWNAIIKQVLAYGYAWKQQKPISVTFPIKYMSRGIAAQNSPLAIKRSPKVDSTHDLALLK
jgi:hypothetical protein